MSAMSELLATQREIAAEITNKLQLKLSGSEKGLTRRYSDNNEAYQLYWKDFFTGTSAMVKTFAKLSNNSKRRRTKT